jgi:hypothetical protein
MYGRKGKTKIKGIGSGGGSKLVIFPLLELGKEIITENKGI